jgi:hypothetical protein
MKVAVLHYPAPDVASKVHDRKRARAVALHRAPSTLPPSRTGYLRLEHRINRAGGH